MHGDIKRKPILFNTAMVQAILDGRKTVTRRAIKPQPTTVHGGKKGCVPLAFYFDCNRWVKPPYQVGDVLWVRETWWDQTDRDEYGCDTVVGYTYKADFSEEFVKEHRWRPSIHMPKEAARIFLKVTDVRVERLQDITNDQADKEGFKSVPCANCHGLGCSDCAGSGMQEPGLVDFMYMWDSTIKKKDLDQFGWDANPFAWVIEFERCENAV
ncbi:MAG: hypothetical protein CVU42_17735 [Chloroflexi bacterium HGW-Chloroflexi-4]|jgi:hypothetical protein|nr:MAG: hypothetical protein CVU42_17735 [Chloroflexi bacterium HGW-Chloroflexi-4]